MPANEETDRLDPIVVYYSYHEQNKKTMERLNTHLADLRRKDYISIWHEGLIAGGEPRDQEIARHWKQAQVIILFISAPYLDDDRCDEQMHLAVERAKTEHIPVIPILTSPAHWGDSLKDLQPLPRDGESLARQYQQDEAFLEVANDIRALIGKIRAQRIIKISFGTTPTTSRVPSRYITLNEILPVHTHSSILQRAELVTEIYTRLTQAEISVLVLTGLAGVGKSTLARLVSNYAEEQRLAGKTHFNSKALWIPIQSKMSLSALLAEIATALGKPENELKNPHPQELVLKIFRLLNQEQQRCLVVLDGFETWLDAQGKARSAQIGVREFIDMLNNVQSASRLLITSHNMPQGSKIAKSAYMQKHHLMGLTETEGVTLLRLWKIQATDQDLLDAACYCKGHPFALVFLDNYLSTHQLALATVLKKPGHKALWVNNVIQNLFDDTYQQLTPLQRHLLLAYAIYREAVPLSAVSRVLSAHYQVTEEQIHKSLEALLTLSLLDREKQNPEECYALHPIVAAFARKHLSAAETSEDIDQQQAHQAAAYYYQQDVIPRFTHKQSDDEHAFTEAVWHYCQGHQCQTAYELWQQKQLFLRLRRRGEYTALLEIYTLLLSSQTWQATLEIKAQLHNEVGEIHSNLGAKEQALHHFEQALELSQRAGEQALQVKALNHLGSIYRIHGESEQALSYYQQALEIHKEARQPVEKGVTLNNIGRAYQEMGDDEAEPRKQARHYHKALNSYKQALVLHKQANDRLEAARTLNNIGEVSAKLERQEEAHTVYMQALENLRQLGEKRDEATVCNNLGTLYRELKQYANALASYTQALEIYQQIGARWDEAVVTSNLGNLYLYVSNTSAALACFVLARDIYTELNQPQRGEISRGLQILLAGEETFESTLAEPGSRSAQLVESILKQSLTIDCES